jgi:uncharacterized protein (TIGR01244 family)
MRIRRINGMFTIANHVEASDVERLATSGYKTLICNRPDGEADDQVEFKEVDAAAQKWGLKAVYLPVDVSGATVETQKEFGKIIEDCPKPVVAYCRSGTRSAMLWSQYDIGSGNGRKDGPERRVGAMQNGAMCVTHTASMIFAAGFNSPGHKVIQIGQASMGRRSA